MVQSTTTHVRRLGLALSGGGLRASLFHIGVLARLAELDLLRQVEVVSTVSGGSIIGALYYLHARNLLERIPDAEITRRHYVDLVARLARDFRSGVRQNLRMRAFADPWKVLRTFRDPRYSRSDRMAELYEEFLYAPAAGVQRPGRVELPGLRIRPSGEPPAFHPQALADPQAPHGPGNPTANDRRASKVPILVINATTLNTGHLFQFTATSLGEPDPLPAMGDLDRNLQLTVSRYRDLADKYQHLPLGVAVAASAAVPGIFPPMALTDLYADANGPITPQLVDGGVHDNQGVTGLLNPAAPCTHLVISDASGQMEDLANPPTQVGAVIARSNAVLMDRVREEEFAVTDLLARAGVLDEVVFFHLKEGMPQRRLTAGQNGAAGTTEEINDIAAHGVDARVQATLARLRTDLDAFTDVEAHALMADGYLIASHHLTDQLRQSLGHAAAPLVTEPWEFVDVVPLLRNPELDPSFLRQLEVGSRRFGKSLALVPAFTWVHRALRWSAGLAVLALLAAVAAAVFAAPDVADRARQGLSLLGDVVRVVLVALLAAGVLYGGCALARATRHPWAERLLRALLWVYPGLLLALLGALLVNRHAKVFDAMRLERGQVSRLVGCAAAGQRSG